MNNSNESSLQGLLGASALALLLFGGSHGSGPNRSVSVNSPSEIANSAAKKTLGNSPTFLASADTPTATSLASLAVRTGRIPPPVTFTGIDSQPGKDGIIVGPIISVAGGSQNASVPEPGTTATLAGIIVGVGYTWLRKKK